MQRPTCMCMLSGVCVACCLLHAVCCTLHRCMFHCRGAYCLVGLGTSAAGSDDGLNRLRSPAVVGAVRTRAACNTNMQQTARIVQRTAGNTHHTSGGMQRATCKVQHARCSMQRAARIRVVHHASCIVQHATCTRQHARDTWKTTTNSTHCVWQQTARMVSG